MHSGLFIISISFSLALSLSVSCSLACFFSLTSTTNFISSIRIWFSALVKHHLMFVQQQPAGARDDDDVEKNNDTAHFPFICFAFFCYKWPYILEFFFISSNSAMAIFLDSLAATSQPYMNQMTYFYSWNKQMLSEWNTFNVQENCDDVIYAQNRGMNKNNRFGNWNSWIECANWVDLKSLESFEMLGRSQRKKNKSLQFPEPNFICPFLSI